MADVCSAERLVILPFEDLWTPVNLKNPARIQSKRGTILSSFERVISALAA